jgi:hypothetical protein
LKESEQGLCKLLGQNNDEPLEAILAEVAIESEGMVEFVTVDQNETGAIDEAEVFVIVPYENRLGRLLICFDDANYSDAALVESLHKLDSRTVTHF